jgi:cytochrome c
MNGKRSSAAGRVWLVATLSAILAATAGSAAAADGGWQFPERPWGADSPAAGCVVCHSLEAGGPFRYAPNLYGIVGAPKARDRAWYGYSQALMTKGGTWTEADLDAYLANASNFAPGTTKTIRIDDVDRRREIIAFLKTLKP